MGYCQILICTLTLLLAFTTVGLRGQDVGAEDATPRFGAKGFSINYAVIRSQPNEEELAIKRRVFGIFTMGVSIRRQNAAGVNICATSDNNVGYAFFKDIVYRLDLKQNMITPVKAADIPTKLFYQVRFEARDDKPRGEIQVLKAPDIGSGPKNPCSLQQ